MLRDDLLMRQIRNMIEAILKAVRLRKQKDAIEAEQTLDDVLESQLALSGELLRAVSVPTLLDMLSPGGTLDDELALTLGLLLAERALVAQAGGRDDDALGWQEKARALLSAAGRDDVEELVADEDALARHARSVEQG